MTGKKLEESIIGSSFVTSVQFLEGSRLIFCYADGFLEIRSSASFQLFTPLGTVSSSKASSGSNLFSPFPLGALSPEANQGKFLRRTESVSMAAAAAASQNGNENEKLVPVIGVSVSGHGALCVASDWFGKLSFATLFQLETPKKETLSDWGAKEKEEYIKRIGKSISFKFASALVKKIDFWDLLHVLNEVIKNFDRSIEIVEEILRNVISFFREHPGYVPNLYLLLGLRQALIRLTPKKNWTEIDSMPLIMIYYLFDLIVHFFGKGEPENKILFDESQANNDENMFDQFDFKTNEAFLTQSGLQSNLMWFIDAIYLLTLNYNHFLSVNEKQSNPEIKISSPLVQLLFNSYVRKMLQITSRASFLLLSKIGRQEIRRATELEFAGKVLAAINEVDRAERTVELPKVLPFLEIFNMQSSISQSYFKKLKEKNPKLKGLSGQSFKSTFLFESQVSLFERLPAKISEKSNSGKAPTNNPITFIYFHPATEQSRRSSIIQNLNAALNPNNGNSNNGLNNPPNPALTTGSITAASSSLNIVALPRLDVIRFKTIDYSKDLFQCSRCYGFCNALSDNECKWAKLYERVCLCGGLWRRVS